MIEMGRTTNRPPVRVADDVWMRRFGVTQRALHWSNAVSFLLLAGTGFGLHVGFFLRIMNPILAQLPPILGRPVSMIGVHLVVAVFYVTGPLIWVLFGDRRAMLADAAHMVRFDSDDRAWLTQGGGYLQAGGSPVAIPPQGRFNAGQKVNAILTVLTFLAFIATGLIVTIWPPAADEAARPFWIAQALHLHLLLGLGALALVAGHIYLSALNPATRHSLNGMVFGRVRRGWAVHHHAKWVAEVERRERQA